MEFQIIKTAVASQFASMQKRDLFRADIGGDALWATYLASFPEGSNPIFRERTEHDCSCCRHFIRTVGNVVSVVDGQLVSVWDTEIEEPAYAAVAAAMSALVKSRPIAGPFLHYEATAGIHQNFEMDADGAKQVRIWSHFFVNIDRRHVKAKADIPSWLGEQRARHDVLLRSLREIGTDEVETVLDLIAQGSLYRGEEHRPAVTQFRELKSRFARLGGDPLAQDLFAWTADASGAVSRIRNTAIGSLLTDLAEGKDLEAAVASFEAKVAPTNYKRPTALVTPAMVAKAKEMLGNLGLLSALDRRFATARDVSVGDVLFADRSAKRIPVDVFDDVAEEAGARTGKNLGKIEEVPVDRFLAEIVPRAESIEVLFENRHQGNLVSLIAPLDPTAGRIFKWGNLFSWSYAGELADAIRERVKRAGGNVTGDLCCRLAWSNFDDLDFHMKEPSGHEIFFGNRGATSPSGGRLDVDMNAGSGTTREPVENIFYANRTTMREGEYRLFVHQYMHREAIAPGFECEMDYLGEVRRFSYAPVVRQGQEVLVARFRYTHKGGIEILESLPESRAGREAWGIQTQSFHRVRLLMASPNYWEGQAVGNRHLFFMLEGCRNDGSARGFFNEFLRSDLEPHRKVFEVVGSKMRPADAEEQLSGLGFSSTRRDSVTCRIRGSFTRTVKVTF